jgi:hypothetical protein
MDNNMKTSIEKNLIYIHVSKGSFPIVKINNTCLSSELDLIETDIEFKIKFHVEKIDIFKDVIEVNNTLVDFKKYILCNKSYYNDYYMTESIVNAGARKYTNDELFFLIKNNIEHIPYDCPYLGAMLTIISYRIIDDIENRKYLIERLIHLKKEFDAKFDENNPHSIRWLISSSATMSMLLISIDRKDDAKKFLQLVKIHYNKVNLNPLSYWNLNQAMILLSLLYIDENDWNSSGTLLLSQFIFSRNALLDIYNPRNDWLLGQLLDCTALLELGKLSLILSTRCLKNNIPPSTRISSFNGDNKPIDFSPLFIRFRGLEKNVHFFKSIRDKIDERRC